KIGSIKMVCRVPTMKGVARGYKKAPTRRKYSASVSSLRNGQLKAIVHAGLDDVIKLLHRDGDGNWRRGHAGTTRASTRRHTKVECAGPKVFEVILNLR